MQFLLFQENLLGFFTITFSGSIIAAYSWLLIVLFRATFLCNRSGTWRRPPTSTFTLTAFHCFFLRFFVFVLLLLYSGCYGFGRVFLLSGIFYLTLFPHMWCMPRINLLLSRFPWELVVLPRVSQGFPLWFETQTWSICLLHIIKQGIYLNLSKHNYKLHVVKS